MFSEAFGECQKGNVIPIGSIKGNIGHLEVASGIAGLLKVLMMIKKGTKPQMVRGTIAQNQEYPILLSAVSRNSLLMGVAALDQYLKGMDSRIAIGDSAFTLSEKRAYLQCRWATIVSDTKRFVSL